jgi:hypothetical protein
VALVVLETNHSLSALRYLLLYQVADPECVVYREVRIAFRAVPSHFDLDGVLDQLLIAEAGRASNGFNSARLDLADAAFLRIVLVVMRLLAHIAEPNCVDLRPTAVFC